MPTRPIKMTETHLLWLAGEDVRGGEELYFIHKIRIC
jgi:hypothetical protein